MAEYNPRRVIPPPRGGERNRGRQHQRGHGYDRGRGGRGGGGGRDGRGGRGGRGLDDDHRNAFPREADRDVIDMDVNDPPPAMNRLPTNNSTPRQNRFRIGWKILKELENKEACELVLYLNGNKDIFIRDVLDVDLHETKPDWIPLVLTLSLRACEAQSKVPQSVTEYLLTLVNSEFVSVNLLRHFMNLSMIRRHTSDKEVIHRRTLNMALSLSIEILERIPSQAFMCMIPMAGIYETVIRFLRPNSEIVDEDIERKVELMKEMISKIHEEKQTDMPEKRGRFQLQNKDDDIPPDDYQHISIIPQPKDLDLYEKPFLRANKASGKFQDVCHYLDVNFRLLREDFVRPLREGIRDYLSPGKEHRRQQNIRIYSDIEILSPVCNNAGLTYKIRFNIKLLKNVRWESSKRLLYGSLVCLSRDRFKTILFGTVSNRDDKSLKKGEIEVKFEHSFHNEITAAIRNTKYIYTMVETSAYYEAYRHVLSGLQKIDPHTMPFAEHLVECLPDVKSPQYLTRQSVYDITALVSPGDSFSHKICPLQDETWPKCTTLGLDDTQLSALKLAITKGLAIIQGPPGTGKTHIGLELVKVLLSNSNSWQNVALQGKKQILIVCYTNHALDQFLEGIQTFHDKGIVRVGGRCISKQLEKYMLKNVKYRMREARELPREIFDGMHQVVGDMKTLEEEIANKAACLKQTENGILHERVLEAFMSPRQYDELANGPCYDIDDKDICMTQEWLGYGMFQQVPAEPTETDEESMETNEEDEEEGIEIEDEAIIAQRQRMFEELQLNDYTKDEGDKPVKYVKCDESILGLKVENVRSYQANDGWEVQRGSKSKTNSQLKQQLRRLLSSKETMTEVEVHRVHDLWALPYEDRWRFYRFLVQKFVESRNDEVGIKQLMYLDAAERMKEIQSRVDLMVMQEATVIGMTTTGAARCHHILQEIKPKIVIVEEAAEVLESHIITSLSTGCQHLVLIGDHKQLRPSATVYELAKSYNLEISLFERMINNGVDYRSLGYQHRMRPKIAELMKFIYPELRNHESVETYDHVKGVATDIYFINHREVEGCESDVKSHYNEFEADYISRFCRYLILQGYKSSQITVLTPYSGQLHKLKTYMPKREFEGVRMTLVDNFQGEENDIILLSLVRSNNSSTIGFLKIDNRVCVALSRAKVGLYVIGNFDHLALHSELWSKILHHMNAQKMCGKALELYCQNHEDRSRIYASKPLDFLNAPEGGCMLPCDFRLPCGHQCLYSCHIRDKEHTGYTCRKSCQKVICELGHKCTKTCAEKCGQCNKSVERSLPCGHKQNDPCYNEISFISCRNDCNQMMLCGHPCKKKCHQQCSKVEECLAKTRKRWECGHSFTVACNIDVLQIPCPEKCKEMLECGHACVGSCGTCWRGRIHVACKQKCDRTLVCGHNCKQPCTKECPPCKQKCHNRCTHSRCQKMCGEMCTPCNEPCQWTCLHYRCTKLCHEPCNRPVCNKPCRKHLKCRHPCIGLCGEPCPNLCRICDKIKVEEIFFGTEDEPDSRFVQLSDCGHIVEYTGLDHWINGQDASTSGKIQIQLPVCPKCKTPIKQHLRYGSKVNNCVHKIEKVKQIITGSRAENEAKVRVLLRRINTITFINEMDKQGIKDHLNSGVINRTELVLIDNQFSFMEAVNKIQSKVNKINLKNVPKLGGTISETLRIIERKLLCVKNNISNQQLGDFNKETTRCQLAIKLSLLLQDISEKPYLKLEASLLQKLILFEQMLLKPVGKLTDIDQKNAQSFIKEVATKISYGGITDAERIQIVKAIGLRQGHWYECPNGHPYAIGECGGAMQRTRCPECRASIGGEHHSLTAGNRVSTRMDGARFGAYSAEANNMRNFNIDDLV